MFAIDHFGETNLTAQEVPSAVGMRGFYIPGRGTFDWPAYLVRRMERDGTLRPCSKVKVTQ